MFLRSLTISIFFLILSNPISSNDIKSISASFETPQVPEDGNADDPAIWFNKVTPESSIIFGTDKYRGIYTYNLKGQVIGFSKSGRVNNIDLRSLKDSNTNKFKTFIFGSNGTNNSLDLWIYSDEVIHQASLNNNFSLSQKSHVSVKTNFLSYGICAGHDKELGIIAFVTEAMGSRVQLWQYLNNSLSLIKTFDNENAYESEGCVYDDENRTLFISEENERGVIRAYKLFNELDFNKPEIIDTREGNITGDPEGLSILKINKKDGYLIASSQGNSTFNIYQRNAPYTFINKFSVISNEIIDGVSDTDGIDILNTYLNKDFPSGILVVQDGKNTGEQNVSKENFKYLSLQDLIKKLDL